jgi:nicotinate phosphoribosyltransferase
MSAYKTMDSCEPLSHNLILTPLLTDLYQLTMLQGYLAGKMNGTAVFEFYARRLPPRRSFLLACGLETLLTFIEGMQFSSSEKKYLATAGRFSSELVDYLDHFKFSGDVYALPEGTVFFANEPVIRVVAPIPEAQLLETRLINILHYEILIASKAARCSLSTDFRKLLVDFGLRRAHGAEAGLLSSRASFVGGFSGSSNVLAEYVYGIPIYGTMAHSFIEAHENELEAFLHFARSNRENTTLLIDTYDTRRGAAKAVEAAKILSGEGIQVRGVRLDSGDLFELSVDVRKILDNGGFPNIRIFVSSSIDEDSIVDLLTRGAPIDGFGVGTKLDTSSDAPYLDSAYKIMEYDGRPCFKTSEGKITLPGRKQIFREFKNGFMERDTLGLETEHLNGKSLLEKVMENGMRLQPPKELKKIAAYAREQLSMLPAYLRDLETKYAYPVEISPGLEELRSLL